jgi:hypothetical protein
VLIRPVRRADARLLADNFTDVDHHDHEALGALDHADGRGVVQADLVRREPGALRYEIMLGAERTGE